MELKKSNDASIEKLRGPIILMGLLFVGSLVLASFSYTVETEREGKEPSFVKSALVRVPIRLGADTFNSKNISKRCSSTHLNRYGLSTRFFYFIF